MDWMNENEAKKAHNLKHLFAKQVVIGIWNEQLKKS